MFFRCLVATFSSFLWCDSLLRAESNRAGIPLSTAPSGLTLHQAQGIALARNADFRIAQIQVDAAIAQLRIAKEFPNPIFGLSVSKIDTDRRSNRTAAGNDLFDRSYDSIVSLSQFLELGKRGPRRAAGQAGQRAAEAQRDDVRRLLIKSVCQAYIAALEAKEEGIILASSAASLRHEADLAAVRLASGDIAAMDKAQIEISAVQRELDAAAARHNATTAILALEMLLGDPAPSGRTALMDSLVSLARETPLEIVDEPSPSQRPDSVAASATLEKADAELLIQQRGKFPDLTVSVQFEHNPPDTPNTAGVGVSLPLPLWNRNAGAIRAARAARDEAQESLEKTRAQISAEIAAARSDFIEARDRLNAYRGDLIVKSANVVHTVGYTYEHGGASLVELLAAERNDNDIRISTVRAQAEAASASFALSAALNRKEARGSSSPQP